MKKFNPVYIKQVMYPMRRTDFSTIVGVFITNEINTYYVWCDCHRRSSREDIA